MLRAIPAGVFPHRQAGMAGIKACRLCRPMGENIVENVFARQTAGRAKTPLKATGIIAIVLFDSQANGRRICGNKIGLGKNADGAAGATGRGSGRGVTPSGVALRAPFLPSVLLGSVCARRVARRATDGDAAPRGGRRRVARRATQDCLKTWFCSVKFAVARLSGRDGRRLRD